MNNTKKILIGLLLLIGIVHACLVLNFYGYFNVDFQRHIIEQKKIQECSDLSVLKTLAMTDLAKSFGTERAAYDFWACSKTLAISSVAVFSLLVAVIILSKVKAGDLTNDKKPAPKTMSDSPAHYESR